MNTFAIAVHLFSSLFLIEGSVNLTLRDEEFMALSYMKLLDERTYNRSKRVNLATWAYESNLTEYNLKQQVKIPLGLNHEKLFLSRIG